MARSIIMILNNKRDVLIKARLEQVVEVGQIGIIDVNVVNIMDQQKRERNEIAQR